MTTENSIERDVDAPGEAVDTVTATRRALYREFAAPRVVWSVDGVTATFGGPLDLGVALGDIVVAQTGEPPFPLVQVHSLRVVEARPIEVDLAGIEVRGAGPVRGRGRPVLRQLEGSGAVLGALTEDATFVSGAVSAFDEAPFRPASTGEVVAVRTAVCGEGGPHVGDLLGNDHIPVHLRAKGFARHTFLCGQSGSGKTYTTGVVLEALRLATDLPIVVLDPNSDHVHLASAADEARGSAEGAAYERLRDEVTVARARGRGGDVDLVAHPSDVPLPVLASALRLDPVTDLREYEALVTTVDSLDAPWAIADLVRAARKSGKAGKRLAARVSNLGIGDWGIWCRPDEESVLEAQPLRRRCVVIDIGSLDGPDEQTFVSALVFGALWRARHQRRSRLVVVDEAHNAFPAAPASGLLARCAELGVLIAGEGRKFGIHLMVATQRPGKVHPNVVSQCDNLMLLRVNSRADVEELAQTFSHVPRGLIERAPDLSLGQVLYAGPISPIPAFARTRGRLSEEGGSDLPTSWTTRSESPDDAPVSG